MSGDIVYGTVQNFPGGGGWQKCEQDRGGMEKNVNKIEGRLDVKFNTYKGNISFSLFFANWRTSGRVIRVQI